MRHQIVIVDDSRPRTRGDTKARDIRQALRVEDAPQGTRVVPLVDGHGRADGVRRLEEVGGPGWLVARQLVVDVPADLRQGGVAADEVDEREGATIAALAQDAD